LAERLRERIIGQDAAIDAVCRAVRRGRLGLADPSRPVGSFIFAGPTGVGKTALAAELAHALFGSYEALIRIDMSEYMESHSVSKLIGSPPGYVGYGETGVLAEKVRRTPYSVVLFDEVEKAHPDVFNLFLQILDDGVLTDARGTRISFKNTVIIMTSNIGSAVLAKKTALGFGAEGESAAAESRKKEAAEALREHFRPEFLGRVDEIIVFDYLDGASIRAISQRMLGAIGQRIETLGVSIRFEESVLALVSARGFNKKSGAREARREIEKLIEDSFAEAYLRGDISAGDKVLCFAHDGEVEYKIESVSN
jgi:ATP-dependent Clp protease ATP-binding subunit ClpC